MENSAATAVTTTFGDSTSKQLALKANNSTQGKSASKNSNKENPPSQRSSGKKNSQKHDENSFVPEISAFGAANSQKQAFGSKSSSFGSANSSDSALKPKQLFGDATAATTNIAAV